jgi:transposase
MQRYELRDEHWALIEPLLPPQRRTTRGGVWRDHRRVVNGIFWVLFSGAAWRDMPDRYGSCKTAHDRLGRWQRDGTWDKVLKALRLKAGVAGLLDYTQYNADTTSVRATRAAGGAQKKTARRRWE